jgi:hypothetical protein
MPLVPARNRSSELKRLGFSDLFIRLIDGKVKHPLLEWFIFGNAEEHCTYISAEDGDSCYPQDARLLPLWEHWETAQVGVWERDGRVEVIEYFDQEQKYRVVARTEHGALAYILQIVRDQRERMMELPEIEYEDLSKVMGFKYLKELRQALHDIRGKQLKYHEDYRDAATAVIDELA